jgi:hypothetical protein
MNFTEIGQALRLACSSAAEVTTVYYVLVRAKSVSRDPGALLQIIEAFGSVPLPSAEGGEP